MSTESIYDIIGIGIGPFNLGLAAMAAGIPNLRCTFMDTNPEFNWHPGLLLPHTRLQVPFYADLVTLNDPTSRFSYLNFLKCRGRMFRFAITENNFTTRVEYNQYCQWVTGQLPDLNFGVRCDAVYYDEASALYIVYATASNGDTVSFHGKHVLIGVGTISSIPECAKEITHPFVFHSSEYLFKKEYLLKQKNITVVGSGQSAAEILYDLLQRAEQFDTLSWYTKSERPYPMDYSKFALEMTSPDYIEYFFNLDPSKKKMILAGQENLYKGINVDLIEDIYNEIYIHIINGTQTKIRIFPNQCLEQIQIQNDQSLELDFRHVISGSESKCHADACILATGYKNIVPSFLDPVHNRIRWNADGLYDVNRDYSIDDEHTIFVQNADLHSHGFNSADLGLGQYRNAVILNQILKEEYFTMEKDIPFQQFS